MDILHLVDRLEELFNKSHAIPLTHNVIVDEDKFLDIIDQMRISVPEEVKKAQEVFTKKDRVMAQAQEEANRTLALARDKADDLIDKEALVSDAKRRADQIIEQARAEAENIKAGADNYAQEFTREPGARHGTVADASAQRDPAARTATCSGGRAQTTVMIKQPCGGFKPSQG